MSPLWREMVRHAEAECRRLGLELAILTCEGWGEGGGRWVTPAESMQKAVWTELHVTGGRRIPLAVARPVPEPVYYEDIALLAFPTALSDVNQVEPVLTPSATIANRQVRTSSGFGGAPGEDAEAVRFTMPLPMPSKPQWVQLE